MDKLYPVGSIYLETTNTNPSSKLGGTWVAYGSSDTYLRLGGNGSGGSNTVKLNANQIPSITTDKTEPSISVQFGNSVGDDSRYLCMASNNSYNGDLNQIWNTANHSHTFTNNNQQDVNITPKYVQVYAWKRTA